MCVSDQWGRKNVRPQRENSSDVDPDPQNLINPDLDPDQVGIQVNKITKSSKHLLIVKSKKLLIFKSEPKP